MRQASLCLLIREKDGVSEILLAMKKRGFGQGHWNGVGGKIDPEKGDRDVFDEDSKVKEQVIDLVNGL